MKHRVERPCIGLGLAQLIMSFAKLAIHVDIIVEICSVDGKVMASKRLFTVCGDVPGTIHCAQKFLEREWGGAEYATIEVEIQDE